MPEIRVLDQLTIDQIAAGEVIERPSSVVKELVENAVDAGATAVTVEIRDGGTSLIRIADNGCGIEAGQVRTAFLPHATSKIRSAGDLSCVASLGFRGEALPSIASVSMTELITKTADAETGTRYVIEGGKERSLEETAAPDGTVFIVRSLFYNTPARRKFMKSPMTEGGYVSELVERLALSHPDISFDYINNGQPKLHTSGNGSLKDVIYQIYGRDVAANLAAVGSEKDGLSISGFIGKPVISRGNRGFENYFINGRYVRSSFISRGIEEGYRTYMMQHRYPFTALHLEMDSGMIDVNVHPAKLELRFANQEELYGFVRDSVRAALADSELIPKVHPGSDKKEPLDKKEAKEALDNKEVAVNKEEPGGGASGAGIAPAAGGASGDGLTGADNPAEGADAGAQTGLDYFMEQMKKRVTAEFQEKKNETGRSAPTDEYSSQSGGAPPQASRDFENERGAGRTAGTCDPTGNPGAVRETGGCGFSQEDLFESRLLDPSGKSDIRIIGQLFGTYWLVEHEEKFYMIDQHAAHEKVLYERTVKELASKEITSQLVSPPIILTLTSREAAVLSESMEAFARMGFEIGHFGGNEYALSAVPANLYGLAQREIFMEMLDSLDAVNGKNTEIILDKVASMSCKAAVKGNTRLSTEEARALIEELFTLENPYSCPHGRPTIICMTKYEIEKKFKRVV